MLKATLNNVGRLVKRRRQNSASDTGRRFQMVGDFDSPPPGMTKAHTVARSSFDSFMKCTLKLARAQLAIVPNRASSVASGCPERLP
jgi:hypothetical protein